MTDPENKINRFIPWFVLAFLMAIFVFGFYGKVFLSPNSFMFNASGDAMKNYYTYAYHIKHDSTYVEFEGMNYPYGEHFLYTDCHPLIANSIKLLSGFFPGIVNYSVGIINFLMIFSFFLTAFFLYVILKYFGVRPVAGVLGAVGITLLAPQIFRLTGHLSLSYSFFIPLTFLLTYKCFSRKAGWKWSLLLMLNNIFWFYIHAYLGIMAVFFVFSFWLIYSLINFRKVYSQLNTYMYLLMAVLIPVLQFKLFVLFTDTHLNRTPNPSGFFLHNAEPDDILLPTHPPLRPLLNKLFVIDQEWEAWSYVGLPAVILILFIIVNSFKNLIKRKKFIFSKKYLPQLNLRFTLWASLILLIFAFGFPFKSFPALLDWFPDVKNFRATGRFAWFFYFAITIACIVVVDSISKIVKKNNRNITSVVLVIVVPLIFIVEGWSYHKETSYYVSQNPNLLSDELPEGDYKELINAINPDDFQAILPLPFYYIGSENFTRPINNNSVQNSMVLSYHTSLPICGSYLTRTGISESKKIVQVVSPDYYDKPIQNDLKSKKPFLILKSGDGLTSYEEKLFQKAIFVYGNETANLYSILPEVLFSSSAGEEIEDFEIKKEQLFLNSGFLVEDTTAFLYYDGFENEQSEFVFSGKRAMSGNKKETTLIAEFPAGTFQKGKIYEASAWMFNGQLDALNFWLRFIFEEYDEVNNSWGITYTITEQSETINGDWSLVELAFKVNDPSRYTCLKLTGKEIDKVKFYMDDLLVREKGMDVYKVLETQNNSIVELFKNNQRIRLK